MKKMMFILSCLFISIGLISAQTTSISGTVVDDIGETVIGASVVVKGTTMGTVTDVDGKFSISVPDGKSTLLVSLIGYKTKEVQAKQGMKIVMEDDAKVLDEIVVTGYGNVKKSSFTGAASTITTAGMEDVPTVSFQAKLAGGAAGIQAAASTGQPGAVESIRIRGTGSINASNEPLYVLDGVPMFVGNASEFNYSQSGNSLLSTINSNDIESITIIKDAAAASLYGSRAANGVIVITTKSGKKGRSTINFRADWGFSDMAINFRPTLGGDARRDLLLQGLVNRQTNAGKTIQEGLEYANKLINDYAEKPEAGWTDWRDYLLRTGKQSNYEVSIQGGNDKTTVFSSLSYTDIEGISIQSDLQRITARLNVTHKVDRFTLAANGMFASSQQNVNSEGTAFSSPMMAISMTTSPQDFPFNPDGSFNITEKFEAFPSALANPLYSAHLNYDKSDIRRFMGSISGQYDIIDALSVKQTLSYDYSQTDNRVWWDPRSNDGRASKGVYQRYMMNRSNLISQSHLTFNKVFDKLHSVNALIGYETENYKLDYTYTSGSTYAISSKPEIENAAKTDGSSHYDQKRMISYLGSVGYDYDSKYYFGGSFRRDGSSLFVPSGRWGNFWSLSGSWRLTQEDFMQPFKHILSDAKVRFSYGINGNQPTKFYSFMHVFGFGNNYHGLPGTAEPNITDSNLTWEKSNNTNFGLDFTLIDRISVTLDLYNRDTKDLLVQRPTSLITGFESVMMNLGAMNNKGVELEIKTSNILKNDFKWFTTFNLAHNKNELVELDAANGVNEMINPNANVLIHRVGEKFSSFYAYEYAGVDPDTGKEMYYVNKEGRERETTTNASEAKLVIIGSADPVVQGGITNNFVYKGFDLGFTFTYSLGGHLYDSAPWLQTNGGTYNYVGNVPSYYKIEDMWKVKGDQAKLPQFVSGNTTVNSSRWMHSTDHLRLKTIALGYVVPQDIVRKAGLGKVRLYAAAVNLFTIKAKGLYLDPELPVDPDPKYQRVGVVRMETPPLRTVSFGIEIGF